MSSVDLANWHMQRRDEATAEDLEHVIFDITKWPVATQKVQLALADIVDTHYILTPPVFDQDGALIKPKDYA